MKYIKTDLLRKEIDKQMDSLLREVGRGAGTITSKGYGMMQAFQIIRSIIDSLPQEQPSEELEKEIKRFLANECAEDDEPSVNEIASHFANWQKERFVKLLDQWEEHAIRGMKKGAVAYHQGKVALIIDLKDSLKEDEK